MESPAAETSPATSGLGFKGMFSKARRGGKDTSSTPSINGTDNSSEGHGVRSSIDSVRDKLRPSRESSIDDGTIVSKPRKLSKLIPGRMKRKKKKNQEGEDDQQDDEDGQDDHVEQPATSTQPRPQPNTGRRSQSTLGGDGDSSLITYDSDTES